MANLFSGLVGRFLHVKKEIAPVVAPPPSPPPRSSRRSLATPGRSLSPPEPRKPAPEKQNGHRNGHANGAANAHLLPITLSKRGKPVRVVRIRWDDYKVANELIIKHYPTTRPEVLAVMLAPHIPGYVITPNMVIGRANRLFVQKIREDSESDESE